MQTENDTLVGMYGHTYSEDGVPDWIFEITGLDEARDYYELRTISGVKDPETKRLVKRRDMVKHRAGGGIDLYPTPNELERAIDSTTQGGEHDA